MKLINATDISSIFGETVTIRKVNGRIVISNRARRKRAAPTEKEIAHRGRLSEAAQYAKRVCQDPSVRELYATGVKKKNASPQSVAIGDYLNAPVVNKINVVEGDGAVGQMIEVHATDDFQVTKVTVMLTDRDGVIVEKGEAIVNQERVNYWEYKPAVARSLKGMTISASAFDRPGNEGKAEIVI